jgi:DNA invertase Pin-like site-specific DNA recombinase
VLAAVAQFERSLISERVIAARDNLRRAGKHLGGTRPFGWRLQQQPAQPGERSRGPVLVEDPKEQAAIETMQKLRKRGKSLVEIRDYLRKQGHSVSHVTIAKVLKRAEAAAVAGGAR